ncbi:MAG: glycosyltransferase [Nanobdellota archaeon]
MADGITRYEPIVGKKKVAEIRKKAKKLKDKHIVFINSTHDGGGVAEILNAIIPIFNRLGIKVGWRVLHAGSDFFQITKRFHNALQGDKINLSKRKKELYYSVNRRFSLYSHFDHDLVVVHDPQPLPLIDFYQKRQPWIFRLHIDASNPNKTVSNYLKQFIDKYDKVIVSKEQYINPKWTIPHHMIHPAIDPLSQKNKLITKGTIDKYLKKYEIPDKPIIAQVSRFDKWKDPLGVIDVFEQVRKRKNCQLILLGAMASDDPEGQWIFNKVLQKKDQSPYKNDIKLMVINSEILVNCVQRKADVIIQKSRKEGFGLTVSEALYKGTPVVSTRVGGIPDQVIHERSGFLHDPDDIDGMSKSILTLLKDERLRNRMGSVGKRFIKEHYLITRLLEDYLELFEDCFTRRV